MAEVKLNHNLENKAVKRILQELKEMQDNPSHDFISLPLADDIFDWQFAIRGASETEFEGGIYHERIQLPAEYPFKPPSFMLLTVIVYLFCIFVLFFLGGWPLNNQMAVLKHKKICFSISNYHPEHWQPSWSVRTALVALSAFMPTKPGGALGSLDLSKEERGALAIRSREAAPIFGTSERPMLIDEIHRYMLSKVPPVTEAPLQIPEEQSFNEHNGAQAEVGEIAVVAEGNDRMVEYVREVNLNADAGPIRFCFNLTVRQRRRSTTQLGVYADRVLTSAVIGITLAIAVLLLKKVLKANSYSLGILDGW